MGGCVRRVGWRRVARSWAVLMASLTLESCLCHQVCFFLLTRYGADPNKCNKYKATPLHYATQLSTVKTLCKFGADVTLRNVDDLTPVQIAIVDGDDDDLIDYLFKVS